MLKKHYKLLSACHEAPMHGHPKDLTGDTAKCKLCHMACKTFVLVPYEDFANARANQRPRNEDIIKVGDHIAVEEVSQGDQGRILKITNKY